ncbi:hypothetical protein [Chondromyces crocatus]|uniref:CRISPR-associated protein Cst1 n=1 Tax=Chondromyces crocatus TaxID=52 RepID=A0A0K1ECD0_CHOCO|nr:hypothetical protein [Chondromyces crocatus]AKT38509.1 uncharacterized protein CMC5_026550 [Chondromyces crocatus]
MKPLHWTGHALIDVGIAGLCAFAGRERPEDLTDDDLDAATDLMASEYYSGRLATFLTCVFMNASFVQPKETPAKREAFIRQYLRAHRAAPDPRVSGLACVFSGRAATVPLVRTHFPLFSGEDVLNFRPEGQTFLPAAGPFVVALFFLPLASRRSEGRLLAVHADDPALTIRFAAQYLEDNRRLLTLALPTERALVHAGYDREQPMWDATKKQYKFADAKGPRSLVVHDLSKLAQAVSSGFRRDRPPTGLSAYLLSNSGQGPSLDIVHIPSAAVGFIVKAAGASTASAWKALTERYLSVRSTDDTGETNSSRARGKKTPSIPGRAGWTRNLAFEDLCAIFDAGFTDHRAAAFWLRRHVLGQLQTRESNEASTDASTSRPHADLHGIRYDKDARSRSWALAELFLKEIMGMKKERLEIIRAFADKLADRIQTKNEVSLRRAVFFEDAWGLRRRLVIEQRKSYEEKGPLLFGLDEFAAVWLSTENDDRLVRDLIAIRVIERLHDLGVDAEAVLSTEPNDGESSSTEEFAS